MLKESDQIKIRVTVPIDSAEKIREALGRSGAGAIGNYVYCSFSYSVTGRFKPVEGANPTIGEVGTLEEVEEVVVEAVCSRDKIKEVYAAVVEAHPYEEPAIDIMPRLEIE